MHALPTLHVSGFFARVGWFGCIILRRGYCPLQLLGYSNEELWKSSAFKCYGTYAQDIHMQHQMSIKIHRIREKIVMLFIAHFPATPAQSGLVVHTPRRSQCSPS